MEFLKFYNNPSNDKLFDENQNKKAWYLMNLIRFFEEKSIDLYKKGLMGGSLHTSIGQEAVAVGVCMNLKVDDQLGISYRGRGQALAKGAKPFKLFAEMLGRIDGYCKGKGGPMHIISREDGILGANGIVAAGISHAVGAALTANYRKTNQVSAVFFGDGATNQGAFHESLNLAAVLKLPVIFICENNLYAEMTPIRNVVMNEHLAERGIAYRIPSVVVDGNNVLDVFEVTKEAVERARNGEGPTFIEAKTYRLEGHMYGDPETYRSREEVEMKRKEEPIIRFKQLCIAKNLLSENTMDQIQKEAKAEIEEAYEKAVKSEQPEMEEIYTDVY